MDGMLENMPSPLFTEWMAFYSIEPFGFSADLYGHALTSSVIANVNRSKGAATFGPDDFMPKEKRRLSGHEIFKQLKRVFKRQQ